MFFFLIYAVVL